MEYRDSETTAFLSAIPAWKFAFVALVAGVMSAFFGVGSGVLIVPLLTLWLGMPVHIAVGTSLATVVPMALVAVALESAQYPDHIVWRYVGLLAAGSIVGVWTGRLLHRRFSERVLKVLLAVVLLIATAKLFNLIDLDNGSGMALQRLRVVFDLTPGGTGDFLLELGLCSVLGIIAGIATAMLGIGGGVIYVPGLVLLFSDFSNPEHPVRATSLATILIAAGVGTFLHARAGNVYRRAIMVSIAPGALGAAAGVFIANAISRDLLNILFGCLLLGFALYLVLSAFRRDGQASASQ